MSVNDKTKGQKYTHQSWVRYGGTAKLASEGWHFNGDHTTPEAAHKAGQSQVGRYARQQRGSGRTLEYHVTAHGETPPGAVSQYSRHAIRDADGVRAGDKMKNPGLEAAAAKAHAAKHGSSNPGLEAAAAQAHAQHSPLTTVHADQSGKTDVHNHIKSTAHRFNDLHAAHNVADRMREQGAKGGAAVMHGDAHSKYVVVNMADAQRLEKAGHKWADHPDQAKADAAAHERNKGAADYAKGMQEGHEKAYRVAAANAEHRGMMARQASSKAMESNTRADHAVAKDAHFAAGLAHKSARDAAALAGPPSTGGDNRARYHSQQEANHLGGANAHRDAEARAPLPARNPDAAAHRAAEHTHRAAVAKGVARGQAALRADGARTREGVARGTITPGGQGAPHHSLGSSLAGAGAAAAKIEASPSGATHGAKVSARVAGKKAAGIAPPQAFHNPGLEKLAAARGAARSKENATASRIVGAKPQGQAPSLQTGPKGGQFYTTATGKRIYKK